MFWKSYPHFIISAILTLLWILLYPLSALPYNPDDTTWQKTFELYRQVPCLSQEEVEFGAQVIAGLNYNSSRIFRKLALMEGMSFAKSKEAWASLLALDLTYEQMLSFEEWAELGQMDIDSALQVLPEINTLDYEAGRAFRNYCRLPGVSPNHALKTIPLLNTLTDAQNRAVQNLVLLPQITAEQALNGLGTIARLTFYQALALESMEKIPGMSVEIITDSLPLISMLGMENGWNAKSLFSAEAMTPEKAWFWLIAYFANPTHIQEKQFHTLSSQDKEVLLRSLYNGGEELIWKINNLHGVTDRFGFEISNHTLHGYPTQKIAELFEELSPQVKSDFSAGFYQTSSKNNKISILKQAIAKERKATANRLTTPNLYALLAQGSELYDSSFRNILVPVLKNEIEKAFSNNLLDFLKETDPGNLFISNFIVSLAQKGKLTTFFPDNSQEQEQILDLVARSAFKDEDAIILFSATFMYLLEVLEPGARSFLINRMSELADEGTAAYSRLITVILQYYLEEFPELLGKEDRARITRLIIRHGAIQLLDYIATPFSEWKKDGVLSSLSIFHPDDDGRESFQSNAVILMDSGYELTFSKKFTSDSMTESENKNALKLIQAARSRQGLATLFNAMQRQHFAVSFVRSVNGLSINHAAYVYSNEKNQELLLEQYILSGTEMLAQRGHSYWRSEQITEPMETLKEQGRLTDTDLRAKQRFLSLGSCGGVKAYTRLNEMFLGHVDILATIGTGLAVINDPYNKTFFEVIAKNPSTMTWKDMSGHLAFIFKGGHGRDYLQPGSLPAILHKILDEEKNRAKQSASGHNTFRNEKETSG